MEHDIAKEFSVGLLCHDAIYIAVCDDDRFMCDMLEEKQGMNFTAPIGHFL